jgi:hypothetical protein
VIILTDIIWSKPLGAKILAKRILYQFFSFFLKLLNTKLTKLDCFIISNQIFKPISKFLRIIADYTLLRRNLILIVNRNVSIKVSSLLCLRHICWNGISFSWTYPLIWIWNIIIRKTTTRIRLLITLEYWLLIWCICDTSDTLLVAKYSKTLLGTWAKRFLIIAWWKARACSWQLLYCC